MTVTGVTPFPVMVITLLAGIYPDVTLEIVNTLPACPEVPLLIYPVNEHVCLPPCAYTAAVAEVPSGASNPFKTGLVLLTAVEVNAELTVRRILHRTCTLLVVSAPKFVSNISLVIPVLSSPPYLGTKADLLSTLVDEPSIFSAVEAGTTS